jgi:drug/metabolite transporter (DMT)-like permease
MALLIAGACIIGVAPICVRLSGAGPVATGFWRMALSVPLMLAWILMTQREELRQRPEPRPLRLLFWAGFFLAIDLCFWHWSIVKTNVANATVLANLAPVFVAMISLVIFKERITKWFAVGLIVAVLGAALLSGMNFSVNREHFIGDLMALGSAFLYGCYLAAIARARQHVSTAAAMFGSAVVCSIILLPLSFISDSVIMPPTLDGWIAVIILAVFGHAIGQGMITYAFAYLPANLCAVILLLQPITAAAMAWMIFSESISLLQAAGAAVIMFGIVLCRFGSNGR